MRIVSPICCTPWPWHSLLPAITTDSNTTPPTAIVQPWAIISRPHVHVHVHVHVRPDPLAANRIHSPQMKGCPIHHPSSVACHPLLFSPATVPPIRHQLPSPTCCPTSSSCQEMPVGACQTATTTTTTTKPRPVFLARSLSKTPPLPSPPRHFPLDASSRRIPGASLPPTSQNSISTTSTCSFAPSSIPTVVAPPTPLSAPPPGRP
ncbi:hypothetical protein BKA80DRAFT_136852 [Phyllosticta citrichinensis]